LIPFVDGLIDTVKYSYIRLLASLLQINLLINTGGGDALFVLWGPGFESTCVVETVSVGEEAWFLGDTEDYTDHSRPWSFRALAKAHTVTLVYSGTTPRSY
jgi:hypothetical protein